MTGWQHNIRLNACKFDSSECTSGEKPGSQLRDEYNDIPAKRKMTGTHCNIKDTNYVTALVYIRAYFHTI